jgi:hypothetical protein
MEPTRHPTALKRARADVASSIFHGHHMCGNILHLLKLHLKISSNLLKGLPFSQTSL